MADTNATSADFKQIGQDLNEYADLLAGVEEILEAEDLSGDARHVAARVCRQLNENLCRLGNQLDNVAREGGAA